MDEFISLCEFSGFYKTNHLGFFFKYLFVNAGDCFHSGTLEDKDQSKLRNSIPSLALRG